MHLFNMQVVHPFLLFWAGWLGGNLIQSYDRSGLVLNIITLLLFVASLFGAFGIFI